MRFFNRQKPQQYSITDNEREQLQSELLDLYLIYHAYTKVSIGGYHPGLASEPPRTVYQKLESLTKKMMPYSPDKTLKKKFDEVAVSWKYLDEFFRKTEHGPFQSIDDEANYFQRIRPLQNKWNRQNGSWEKKHNGETILMSYISSGNELCSTLCSILNVEPFKIEEAADSSEKIVNDIRKKDFEERELREKGQKKVDELMSNFPKDTIIVRALEKSSCNNCPARDKEMEIRLTHRLFGLYSQEELVGILENNFPGTCDNLLKYFLERKEKVLAMRKWQDIESQAYGYNLHYLDGRVRRRVDLYDDILDVFLVGPIPKVENEPAPIKGVGLHDDEREKLEFMKASFEKLGDGCRVTSYQEYTDKEFRISGRWCISEPLITLGQLTMLGRAPNYSPIPIEEEAKFAEAGARIAEAKLREKRAKEDSI